MRLAVSLGGDGVVETGAAFNANNEVIHVDRGSAASLAGLQVLPHHIQRRLRVRSAPFFEISDHALYKNDQMNQGWPLFSAPTFNCIRRSRIQSFECYVTQATSFAGWQARSFIPR